MFKRTLFLAFLLSSATVAGAEDLSNRMDQMQDQIRQLTGQIEQLTYQIKLLQQQRKQAAAEPAPQPQATQQAAEAVAAPPLAKRPKPIADQTSTQQANAQGVETIGETPLPPQPATASAAAQPALAPPPGPLGRQKAAQNGDGGFQGKLLVAPNGTAVQDGAAAAPGQQLAIAQPASVQQSPVAETPDDLFQRNYTALLQLRYPEAEAGFKEFITRYPDHGLAGTAGYWLGETYWAEQNFSAAAQAYQDSYRHYPKGRRAADSLLKLGLSLARLGQRDQACTVIASLDTEYANAVDARKRAQAAFKREGCG